jgi:hypothetical protein
MEMLAAYTQQISQLLYKDSVKRDYDINDQIEVRSCWLFRALYLLIDAINKLFTYT